MHRALLKIVLSLAVAVGLTFAAAPLASATTAAPAQAAQAAAPSCTPQGQALTKAYNNHNAANAYVVAADAKVKKAKKKLKKAKKNDAPAKKVKKLKKKLKKAKKAKKAGVAVRAAYAGQYNSAYAAWTTCKGRPDMPVPASPQLPVQALCDAIPELGALCDKLAEQLDPLMTGFEQLCAMAPAEAAVLCDALRAGLTDPAGLVEILTDTLIGLGLGDAVVLLQPVLDGLDSVLDLLAGGLPGAGDLPSIPGLPGLPSGGNPLCVLLPLPGLC